LVTISKFVRESVIDRFPEAQTKISAIPIGAPRPLVIPSNEFQQQFLGEHGLTPGKYLLYPANFWRHKNHEVLLMAFRLFREKYPESEIKLVLTGALKDRRVLLEKAAEKMELSPWIWFAGFLPEDALATLYKNARALIFPSLYEGFGIPVLEAMMMGIPVACSRVASLPEVAGDAAVYFDPHNPTEISDAIEQIVFDDHLRDRLIAKGYQQAMAFSGIVGVADQYINLFESLQHERPEISTYELHGKTPDGWLQASALFFFPNGKDRSAAFTGNLPEWVPFPITVSVQNGDDEQILMRKKVFPGTKFSWQIPLPDRSAFFRIHSFPPYRPAEWNATTDNRSLGFLLEDVQVIDENSGQILWRSKDGDND
jgi:hypothetical protein